MAKSACMVAACRSLAAAGIHAKAIAPVLNLAVLITAEVMKVDTVKIFLFDRPSATLKLKACFEKDLATVPAQQPFQPGEGIVGMVADSGKPAIFENTATDLGYHQFAHGRTAGGDRELFFAAFPIRAKSNKGVLACIDTRPRELSEIDTDFIEAVTDQLAALLDHLDLSDRLEMTQRELLDKTDDLDRRVQARAQLSSFVSREMRTRLTSIIGFVERLREQALGEITLEQADALDTIGADTDNLLATLQTLFETTQSSASADIGKFTVSREKTTLRHR